MHFTNLPGREMIPSIEGVRHGSVPSFQADRGRGPRDFRADSSAKWAVLPSLRLPQRDQATGQEAPCWSLQVQRLRCRTSFPSTTGTILEQTHLPIRLWLMAFAIMCCQQEGRLGFAAPAPTRHRRILVGLAYVPPHSPCDGRGAYGPACSLGVGGRAVQVDETYVGGKSRARGGKPAFCARPRSSRSWRWSRAAVRGRT